MKFFKNLFSSKKSKDRDDTVLSLYRYFHTQTKLVDIVCKRDIETYDTKKQQLISLINSDWVFGYILGLCYNYFSHSKLDMLKEMPFIMNVIAEVIHSLNINYSGVVEPSSSSPTEHVERIDNFINNSLYEDKDTESSKGFFTGMHDYSNFLEITKEKVKINKILPYMELCHYLTDTLDLGRIEETNNDTGLEKKL